MSLSAEKLGMVYRAHLGAYWLLIGVWVGALVMLAITAAITFRTVRTDFKLLLINPPYSDPILAPRAPEILAGGIVGNVIEGLAVVQGVCAGGLVLCLVLQATAFSRFIAGGVSHRTNRFRVMLIVLPILVYGAERTLLTPEIWRQRRVMYDLHATEGDRAQATATFGAYHKISERLVGAALLLLIVAALISPMSLMSAPQSDESVEPDEWTPPSPLP